eukprot:GHVQ01029135.1.p1 GENE.GHVQ01029135.1~~GHVQ01029135.1.p1  ORF type:complete len:884 (+),score=179.07 GHVQ01029135.1:1156-3807(+)
MAPPSEAASLPTPTDFSASCGQSLSSSELCSSLSPNYHSEPSDHISRDKLQGPYRDYFMSKCLGTAAVVAQSCHLTAATAPRDAGETECGAVAAVQDSENERKLTESDRERRKQSAGRDGSGQACVTNSDTVMEPCDSRTSMTNSDMSFAKALEGFLQGSGLEEQTVGLESRGDGELCDMDNDDGNTGGVTDALTQVSASGGLRQIVTDTQPPFSKQDQECLTNPGEEEKTCTDGLEKLVCTGSTLQQQGLYKEKKGQNQRKEMSEQERSVTEARMMMIEDRLSREEQQEQERASREQSQMTLEDISSRQDHANQNRLRRLKQIDTLTQTILQTRGGLSATTHDDGETSNSLTDNPEVLIKGGCGGGLCIGYEKSDSLEAYVEQRSNVDTISQADAILLTLFFGIKLNLQLSEDIFETDTTHSFLYDLCCNLTATQEASLNAPSPRGAQGVQKSVCQLARSLQEAGNKQANVSKSVARTLNRMMQRLALPLSLSRRLHLGLESLSPDVKLAEARITLKPTQNPSSVHCHYSAAQQNHDSLLSYGSGEPSIPGEWKPRTAESVVTPQTDPGPMPFLIRGSADVFEDVTVCTDKWIAEFNNLAESDPPPLTVLQLRLLRLARTLPSGLVNCVGLQQAFQDSLNRSFGLLDTSQHHGTNEPLASSNNESLFAVRRRKIRSRRREDNTGFSAQWMGSPMGNTDTRVDTDSHQRVGERGREEGCHSSETKSCEGGETESVVDRTGRDDMDGRQRDGAETVGRRREAEWICDDKDKEMYFGGNLGGEDILRRKEMDGKRSRRGLGKAEQEEVLLKPNNDGLLPTDCSLKDLLLYESAAQRAHTRLEEIHRRVSRQAHQNLMKTASKRSIPPPDYRRSPARLKPIIHAKP